MKLGASCFALALVATPASAATFISTVVATGLNNPRDLAFGPDGALYIAEAGFNDPSVAPTGNFTFMSNGSVTRLFGGMQTRVMAGLPSLYNAELRNVSGPQGIVFDTSGTGYLALGLGADPAVRPAGSLYGHVFSLGQDFDVAGYEAINNPDGGPLDSNPFHLAAGPDGLLVTDAGGNALLNLAPDGAISTVAVFPNRFIGGPVLTSNAVPTGIAVAPDGTIYVSQLTGFPFTEGEAQIFSIAPGSSTPTVFATGFTNLTDLAFGPDGNLYALSIDTNNIIEPGGSGAIYRVSSSGMSENIFSGLVGPTGLTFGSDGALYVTNFSNSIEGGLGQVIRVSEVPEPATWAMMLLGFAALGTVARRRRAKLAVSYA
jgi:sugar lactone lactonase YvrE